MLYVDIEKRLTNHTLNAQLEINGAPAALLGASGAGKSMTLKCIAGIVRPDRGVIRLNDTVLFDSEKRINLPVQKRRVGYLFQDYALFPNMSVIENIKTGLHRLPRAQRAAAAEQLLGAFRLSALAHARPDTLSGGEKQRVALARTLASKPTVLLLDEPFSSLDTVLKWELEAELKERLQDFAGDVIMVTHNIDEALELCENVYTIADGVTDHRRTIREYYRDLTQHSEFGRITLTPDRADYVSQS